MTIENQGLMFVLIITFCYGEEIRDVIKRRINVFFLFIALFVFACLFDCLFLLSLFAS
jgi:hypothetical protein